MSNRHRHNLIKTVLESLSSERFRDARCYFGGSTAMALRFGEFRESMGADFIISDTDGYRSIRDVVNSSGFDALMVRPIPLVREPVMDQYGIRALLDVDGTPIKFEIISEGRIELDDPGASDVICGVTTLSIRDLAASKLLANSDRWADTSVFSRDLIDLAMMEPSDALMSEALDKADGAYGASIVRDLNKAIDYHRDNPHRLDECIHALRMTTPKAVVWERIQRVRR